MVEAKPASPLSALYHNTSLQLTAGLQKTPYTHAQITYTFSLAYVHALIHSTSLTRKSSITNHEVATHLITILLQRLDKFFCMLDIHPAQLVSILIARIVCFFFKPYRLVNFQKKQRFQMQGGGEGSGGYHFQNQQQQYTKAGGKS